MIRQAIRWLLGHDAPRDPEKQHQQQQQQGQQVSHASDVYPDNRSAPSEQQNQNPSSRLSVVPTAEGALVPPTDKLLVFRSLTGIDTVPTLSTSGHSSRAAPNHGIYPRIVRAERKAKRGYRVFNVAINACLGIQMVVAAALTALGAANGSRAAVTGFGAVNTIIAGLLTYIKGSGLPNRLKYVADEFRAVREYIEQREREFCLADCPLNPYEEVQIVDDMYGAAKQNMEGKQGQGGGGQRSSVAQQAQTTASSGLAHAVQRFSKFTESSSSTKVPPQCHCEKQSVKD
ncbi:C6 transcription factor [Purpureocillium lavendulum]|uniref:C6 transcription factor n=1 Tax=Purpureocillium lavendulum TaxID=1247861 RepID=A0AB34FPV2_9HYPO|nr:C6 transcription factor [Purpureocillium lavendulum]